MTEEQMCAFIEIAQLGWTMGCEHPLEWFMNYMLHQPPLVPWEDWSEIERKAYDAFIAFFRGCDSGPGDPIVALDKKAFIEMVNNHYSKSPLRLVER